MARRCNNVNALLFLAVLLLGLTPVCAQEREADSGRQFFPRNFVNSERAQPAASDQRRYQLKGKASAEEKRLAVPNRLKRKSHPKRGEESPAQSNPTLENGAQEVETVGAILSSSDPAHLRSMLEELLEVALRYDFALGDIYTVGFPPDSADLKPLLIKLAAREGNIMVRGEVPEKYQVSKSPAWIIATSAGEFLLEGTGPLEENFNSQGKFLDKHRKLDES